MIGGQVVDVEMTGKQMSGDQLHFVYENKTGALIEASMMIGAVLAGATEDELKQVEMIASDIGLAFQIQDDLLIFWVTVQCLENLSAQMKKMVK